MNKSTRSVFLWYNLILFLIFLVRFPLGIGLTIFQVFHLLPLVLISKGKILPQTLIKVALSLVISVLFWNRAAIGYQLIALLSIAVLNYFIFYEVSHKKTYDDDNIFNLIKNLARTLILNIMAIMSPPSILPKIKGLSTNTRKIIYGVLASLPLLIILSVLFASADATFEQGVIQVSNFLGNIINLKFLQVDTFSLMFTGFFFAWYIFLVIPTKNDANEEISSKYVVEFITVSAVVSLVFGLFILTQYQNVQTILQGFRLGTLNPREFVREGFYQMTIASGIAFAVVYLLEHNLRDRISQKISKTGKIVAGILLFEIITVILLAFQRVWAYQYAYGYTQLRLWGIVLVVWLLGISLLFLGRLYRLLSSSKYIQAVILFSGSLVLLVGLINIDKTIASVKPPTINGNIDYSYLGILSYDAAAEWENVLETVEPDELPLLLNILNNEGIYYYTDQSGNIVSSEDGFNFKRCEEKWYGFATNVAVNKGKDIVCENLDRWKGEYERIRNL